MISKTKINRRKEVTCELNKDKGLIRGVSWRKSSEERAKKLFPVGKGPGEKKFITTI